MIVQRFNLNLIPNQSPVIVHVNQYDTGTGRLVATLYEGNEPYSPSGTAVIQGTKPDGHGFQYTATLDGNVVTADLTEQMSPVAGDVRAQIVVTESSGVTGTFVFIMRVQPSALPSDTEMSESDYPLIEEAIREAQEAVIDSHDNAENSEAWAQGTRNGTAVPPTDPTYQQNSKYWAGQAEQYAQGGLKFVSTIYFASLPTSGMRVGDMYNIKDAFTTDSRFEEGAGIRYPEGTNVAWTPNNKWDVLAGNIRVLVSITLEQFNALTPAQKNDPTIWWWVPDANNGTMGGSVSSVTAYPELTDKPSINGVEINGAMTSSMLHLAGELPEIMPISKGGTGNNAGYIRTGRKANTSIGNQATAEGSDVTASGYASHGEGLSTKATGNYSHSESYTTTASGHCSHAEGFQTTASGQGSHAGGYGTIAANDYQTAIGKYNDNKSGTLFEVGNGSSGSNRSNAFEVYKNGDIDLAGQIKVKGTPLIRSMGFEINAVPTGGTVSIGEHSEYAFTAITSQATWDDNFSEYKPFSIICAKAGSPTTKHADLVVTINGIRKDTNTGRIYIYGSIFNASGSTIFVSKISVRVLAVALSSNPMEDWSVLD